MPVSASIYHALSATTPDDPSEEIQIQHWNQAHAITASMQVLATEISGLFSNKNGVSFGLDGTNITASVGAAGGGLTNINVSAGTTSNNLSAVTFGNANGVTFGLDASTITASHNGLTTARASNDGLGLNTAASNVTWTANSSGVSIDARGYAGTGTTFNAANLSGSMTLNSNGLNLSLSAAAGGGGGITNINVSAGTTSQNLSALTLSDSNGLAFGLNGSVITGSYTQSTHSHSTGPAALAAGTQTGTSGTFVFANSNNFTFGMSGSSQITASFSESTHSHSTAPGAIAAGTQTGTSGTIAFVNSNGITFGMSGSTQITASHNGLTTARASNDAIGLNTAQSNVTWTVNSAGLSLDARGYAGTGTSATNASVTLNSNGIAISVAAGGGATPVASASNGSFSFTTIAFSNANNVTFGTSAGSIITASVAAPGAAAEQNAINLLGANTAGNTTATGSTIGLSGVNVTLSGTNNSQIVISAPATSSLVGSNGISLSSNGSTVSIMNEYESYFKNVNYVQGTSTQTVGQSTSVVFPMEIDNNLSLDRMQMLHTISMGSTSIASTGNTSYSYSLGETHNWVFYSRGQGASSMSLQSINSTSAGFSMSIRVSQNTTNNISVSHGFTFPRSDGTQTLSFSYAATNSTMQVSTTHLTALTGVKIWDTQFASTLPEGQIWAAFGISTAQTTQQTAVLSAARMLHSHIGVTQPNNTIGSFGSANNASIQLLPGLGSFSTNAIATTASLGLSKVSSSASHVLPMISFMRIA